MSDQTPSFYKRTWFIVLALVVVLGGILYEVEQEESQAGDVPQEPTSEVEQTEENVDEANRSEPSAPQVPLPPFSVIEDESVGSAKRSVDIRLENRITEEELAAIANHIVSSRSRRYDRTFILYYLPNMDLNAGAWASSHFNPSLEVKIIGTTIHEQEVLTSDTSSDLPGELLGNWIDERPFAGHKVTLSEEGDTVYLTRLFPDGSGGTNEMVSTQTSAGLRIGRSANSEDYYLLRSNGTLELRDSMGLITTLKRE